MKNNFINLIIILAFLVFGNSYANNKIEYSVVDKTELLSPTVTVDGTNIIITINSPSNWGGSTPMNGIVWFDLYCDDVFIERYPLAVGRNAVALLK